MKRNFAFFMAALFMAILLWLQEGNVPKAQKQRSMTLRLEVKDLPREFVTVLPPSFIEVVAEGTPEALQKLREEDVVASVDLSEVKEPGNKDARVRLRYPPDLGVTVTPKQRFVRYSIDKYAERQNQEVVVKRAGELPKGLFIDSLHIRTYPAKVKVQGASSLLKDGLVARVTLKLPMLNAGETPTEPVEIIGPDGEIVQGLKAEPSEVTIDPKAVSAPLVRTVLVQVSYQGKLPAGYQLSDAQAAPLQVELRASQSGLLDSVVRVLTEPVSLDGLTGPSRKKVKLQLPDGVTAEPAEVEVALQVTKGAKP